VKISAQEYTDIALLYAYFNLSDDLGTAEEYASCFTEDGVVDNRIWNRVVSGRAALLENKRQDKAKRGTEFRRHVNSSHHMEKVDERTIRSRCYLQLYRGQPGGMLELMDAGHLEDIIVLDGDEWKIKRRTAFPN
jgi:hypothetical protein